MLNRRLKDPSQVTDFVWGRKKGRLFPAEAALVCTGKRSSKQVLADDQVILNVEDTRDAVRQRVQPAGVT